MKQPLPRASRSEIAVTENELVLAEQQLTDERTDRRRRDRAEDPEPDDDQDELAHAGAEVVVPALAGEPRQLREERRLHRLEQQDRDARDEESGDEQSDARFLARGREEVGGEEARIRQQLREHGAEQEQRERAGQLGVGRNRAGLHESALAAQRDRDRTERREHEREPVQPRRPDAGREERDAEREPDDAFRAVHHAVGLEAAVAGERAAGDVGEVSTRPAR